MNYYRLYGKKGLFKKAFSTIGFIGVGNMGGFMAKNVLTKSALLQVPHRVLVFDKLPVITIVQKESVAILWLLQNDDNLTQANIDNLKAAGAESTTESVTFFDSIHKYHRSDE